MDDYHGEERGAHGIISNGVSAPSADIIQVRNIEDTQKEVTCNSGGRMGKNTRRQVTFYGSIVSARNRQNIPYSCSERIVPGRSMTCG
jgi:hypothetical protein